MDGLAGNALSVAAGLLAAGLAVSLLRLVMGPTRADRLLAIETAALLLFGVLIVLTVRYSPELFPAAVILAIMGVISSVAVSKYLTEGRPF